MSLRNQLIAILIGVVPSMVGMPIRVHAAEPATANPPTKVGEGTVQAYDGVEVLNFDWGWIRWLMSDKIDPKAEMTLGLVHIKPHQENPAHFHPNSGEYLHVLEGSCEHLVGKKWVTLKKGDTLRIPANVPHRARTGNEACKAMIVYDTGHRIKCDVADKSKD